jgi:NADH dehydrogenase [ubiquinone] 1 alpha subcomplex assembly factor 5
MAHPAAAEAATRHMTRTSFHRPTNAKMFSRKIKSLQRAYINSADCDIHSNVAKQMVDRRSFIKRESPVVLEVGAGSGWYLRHLLQSQKLHGLKQYIQTDISEERLNKNYNEVKDMIPPDVEFVQICADEEDHNPFGIPHHSVDMVVSNLSMHWVNDLDTAFASCRQVLKRDALFLMSMFGGNTLYELRSSFSLAQTERLGGVISHTSPMIDGAGISGLMLQAGFALPTVDMDRHCMMYDNALSLMRHLQSMGESACHLSRKPLTRKLLASMSQIYVEMYGKNNVIPATFEVFHVIGWSPCPISQKPPLERGAPAIPMTAIATGEAKALQESLQEFAKNPENTSVQAQAIQRLQELSTRTRDQLRADGIDVPDTFSPHRKKASGPAPPGQFIDEASSNSKGQQQKVVPPLD